METAQIDIRIGDSLVVALDENMNGRIVVNGVEIRDVIRFSFGYDWNTGSACIAETDIAAGPLVATIEHLVDTRLTSEPIHQLAVPGEM